jgi:DNA gyrase subunit A
MPLPEDEDSWAELDVMFATTRGTVRRNKLSDFVQVNRNGKIAMKLDDEGDAILNVETCNEFDDVLLTTALGQCIRFPVDDVRVFAGRNSIGVRGMNLGRSLDLDDHRASCRCGCCRTRRLSQARHGRTPGGNR